MLIIAHLFEEIYGLNKFIKMRYFLAYEFIFRRYVLTKIYLNNDYQVMYNFKLEFVSRHKNKDGYYLY